MSVWDAVAARIRELVEESTRAASPGRGRVRSVDPLVIEGVDDDLDLEEGDPDVEIAHGVKADATQGDHAVVHRDEDGGFLVTALLKEEE